MPLLLLLSAICVLAVLVVVLDMQSRHRSIPDSDDPLARVIAPPPDESPDARAERLRREAEAQTVSDEIDERIKQDRVAFKKKGDLFKLLLLGQSESGKSTTLKNFQLTFSPNTWRAERLAWRAVVQLNLVLSVNAILDALAAEMAASPAAHPHSPGTSPPSSPQTRPLTDTPESSQDRPQFTSTHSLLKLRLAPLKHVEADLRRRLGAATDEISPTSPPGTLLATPFDVPPSPSAVHNEFGVRANRSWRDVLHGTTKDDRRERRDNATDVIAGCREDIGALWRDEAVRAMLKNRGMKVEEAPGFFLDDVDRIATRDYEPSDDDVVRARLRTLGVQEHRLVFENQGRLASMSDIGREWLIYDVGGARSSRAAWLPYFDDAQAILFLAPISCFDQLLAEDPRVNRLEDSFILWKSIVSSKLLAKCIIVLFLNKYDLLEKKLASGAQVRKYMPSFNDRENSAPVVAKYLHHKFREQHKEYSPEQRVFYGYVTSVIDTKATSSTLASVRDGLLRSHLRKADFV